MKSLCDHLVLPHLSRLLILRQYCSSSPFLSLCILTLAAVSNSDLLGGLAALGIIRLDLLDDLHALDDLTEDEVFAFQTLGLGRALEELGAVVLGPTFAIEAGSSPPRTWFRRWICLRGSVVDGEVTALAPEVGDDLV
jgi:hypothetical protein